MKIPVKSLREIRKNNESALSLYMDCNIFHCYSLYNLLSGKGQKDNTLRKDIYFHYVNHVPPVLFRTLNGDVFLNAYCRVLFCLVGNNNEKNNLEGAINWEEQ